MNAWIWLYVLRFWTLLYILFVQNTHVHAYVYPEKWNSISKDMVEGGLYIITNFYTKEALGNLRPTSSKIIINFSNSTTVEKLAEDDFMIPMHKFEFIDLSELLNIAIANEKTENPMFSTGISFYAYLLYSCLVLILVWSYFYIYRKLICPWFV